MEIAFISSNKLRFELDKKQRNLSSAILTIFYKNPQQYISTMLVGNNVSLVIYGLLIAQSLKPLLATIENDFFIILVQIIIATTVVLITGEFLPKTIFRINPNLWLKIFSFLLFVFYVLLYPISGFSSWLSLKFMKLAGVGAQTDAQENVFFKYRP
jgi:CBS domain containing-hemolysin-like protein